MTSDLPCGPPESPNVSRIADSASRERSRPLDAASSLGEIMICGVTPNDDD